MNIKASFTKLKTGQWGVRIVGGTSVEVGQNVDVAKRDGSTSSVTVERVAWTGQDNATGERITVCEIVAQRAPRAKQPRQQQRRQPPRREPRGPDVRIEYPVSGATYCHDEHGVYEYDEYPRSSVLAGQQRRSFKTSGTLEKCQQYCKEKYGMVPELISGCGYVKPYVGHLSADGDPDPIEYD